jgi:hypothetical protein
MKETLYLDSTPCDEECAQLGSRDYDYARRAKAECQLFIMTIKEKHGEPPEGAYFRVKANPHDFGTYYSVELVFDDENEDHVNYAYDKVDYFTPTEWSPRIKKVFNQGGTAMDALRVLGASNGRSYGLNDLIHLDGRDYDSIMSEGISDGACQSICTRCGMLHYMEPDQDRGWCDACSDNTVKSALVLGGII